jgi:hypothetical protein
MVERPRPVAWITVGRRANIRVGMSVRWVVEEGLFMEQRHDHKKL